ncbi:MAG: hypothetical protein LC687_03430 [Actinobacteria bacterium]|nr:hypothetical protein [Actinomycetota bacterium]MCA1806902.1 hypothetical protein [Actinomycetota bacterium]
MATLKEFTFVGVSEHKGKVKVRYANNKGRVKKLEREGHTNIFFLELEEPSLKEDCIDQLLDAALPDDAAQEAVRKEALELGFIV